MKLDTRKVNQKKSDFPTLNPESLESVTCNDRTFNFFSLSNIDSTPLLIKGFTDFLGGYAEHTREVLTRLDESHKFHIQLEKIPSLIDLDPFEYQRILRYTFRRVNPKKATMLLIAGPGWMWHERKRKVKTKIAWTMTESRKFPKYMKKWFDQVDEVWMPTPLDKVRFEYLKVTGCSVKVVRLGVDINKYNPNVEPMKIEGLQDKFVFGFVGSWNARKGVKEIVRSFIRAFEGRKDVALLMFAKYSNRPYGWKRFIKDHWTIQKEYSDITSDFLNSQIPTIKICDVSLHPNLMPHLMARMDCGIGASKGESTWLPGLQFGAMKKPVIQTDWGGFRDYLNHGNSYLVRVKGFREADKDLYLGTSDYYKGEEFAVVDEDDLVDKMKAVERDSSERNLRAENLYKEVLECSWDSRIETVSSLLT